MIHLNCFTLFLEFRNKNLFQMGYIHRINNNNNQDGKYSIGVGIHFKNVLTTSNQAKQILQYKKNNNIYSLISNIKFHDLIIKII